MIDEYLESKVTTATPFQLHLMVVDGALRHARAAETALAQRKLDEAAAAFDQARQFVAELMAGLDATRLPDVVDKLKALFAFVLKNLAKADLHRDARLLADSIAILRSHRDTWMALAEKLKEESAGKAVAQQAGLGENRFCWSS